VPEALPGFNTVDRDAEMIDLCNFHAN
jgi:hypothetical protein